MGRASKAYSQLPKFVNQVSDLKNFDLNTLKKWEKILAEMVDRDSGKFVNPDTQLKLDVIRAIIKFKENMEEI